MTELTNNRKFGISTAGLHILAMALMVCDHTWATVLPWMVWLTMLGRIAFPIFAFMIAEGFYRTSSRKKYMQRMLVFAVISEIPFNLIYGNSVSYLFHQNVLWTYLIALSLLCFIEKVKAKDNKVLTVLAIAGSLLVGYVIGMITFVDFYGPGVVTVILFYLFRKHDLKNFVILFVLLYYINVEMIGGRCYIVNFFGHELELVQQSLMSFALIPIWLFNGKKGFDAKWFKYFNYAFYPGHLMVLWVIWQIAIKIAYA